MMQPEDISVNYCGQSLKVSIRRRNASDHLLLFLHGLGCTKESFDGAFTTTELNAYSLCTLDFLGFGASDKPSNFSYQLEEQAAVVRKVVDQLAPKTVSIIAHSMGGAIGLLLAQQLPYLTHFINVEGNLLSEDCGLVSRDTAKQSLQDFQQRGFQDFLQKLVSSERQDFRAWAKWYTLADPTALHASTRSMVKWSDSGQLLKIFNSLANKTYIYGDEEPKDYLLPRFQDAQICHIPQLKHFMMIENPEAFFGVISEALAR